MEHTKNIFAALLGLEIGYLIIAVFLPLPGWKMFTHLERPPYRLVEAATSQEVSLEKYLPTTYFSLSTPEIIEASHFACRQEHRKLRLEIQNPGKEIYVIADDCQMAKP
jgi:hypothetical protein